MNFDIFVCSRTRVAEAFGFHRDFTSRLLLAHIAHDAQSSRLHASVGPVLVASRVAYRDGKSAKVGTDNVDHGTGSAADVHRLTFATVFAQFRRGFMMTRLKVARRGQT